MLATTVALVVMVLSDWMVPSVPNAEGAPSLIHVLPDLLLFMASVTGTLCIVMTWPVHRLRKTKPPLAVTLYALSISVMPLLFALGGNWWRR